MTEKQRFVCYFDDILKKWCVHNTDSLDMYYVADEPMGEEFAHLLNLYHQTLDNVEKENEQLKSENETYKNMFFEIVETALTDKNCRELYCKGILDIFDKANTLNQAREMIKEHLK